MDALDGAKRRTIDNEACGSAEDATTVPARRDPPVLRSTPSYDSDITAFARNASRTAGKLLQHVAESNGRAHLSSSASASKSYSDEPAAQAAFTKDVARLTDVNRWSELSGVENAKFSLFDASGKPVDGRSATVGDFVRVQLPGQPQSDWVRVEAFDSSSSEASLRVRPSYDPTKSPLTPDVTAHFFTKDATNTFIVKRDGARIEARVEGRNESANAGSESGGPLSAVRNRAAAEGAWGIRRPLALGLDINGMQQHQWNVFTKNLVDSGSK